MPADGDLATALDALYREHARDVATYVARRVPATSVDDVCQEVWLAAREAWPRYRGECTPRVWLRVLARNKVIDVWRRRPDAVTLSSSLADAPEVAKTFGVKAATTPSRKLARAEASRDLARALATLDADDREMLALRFLDGLKPAEIALVVGVRANTVSQRIVRTVRRLREVLAEA
jgi:RNA polymerase sigma-70 factor (ECF subfamily)